MSRQVIIIDYDIGNVASVQKAFTKLGVGVKISSRIDDLETSDYIVLPGVGAFKDGMDNLKRLNLIEILRKRILVDKTPFLGICLGMQLLAKSSSEHGTHQGLGWIDAQVERLSENKNIRIPHIGWDDVELRQSNDRLFSGVEDLCFYFVHSFVMKPHDPGIATSYCEYGEKFVSSIRQGNIFAIQFHPEKSQKSGLKLLDNFLNLGA